MDTTAAKATVVVTTEAPPDTQAETTTTGVTAEGTTTSEATVTAERSTATVDDSVETSTSNPNQIDQDQTVVIAATVVADANTGSNTIVDGQADQGGSQQPAEVDSGDATAVGSDDENIITQAADIVLIEGARANVVQVALILNIGVALANSGGNIVGSTPGGSGTSGQIGTGDASATGLDIGQYITQAARENGDENTDAHASQIAISLWMGVAGANSGTNVISGTGVAGSGGSVGSGNASATGNESLTEIEQYANILGVDQSTINVTQQATVLNVGFALSNTGLNDVSGVASGLLTASEADDDAVAQNCSRCSFRRCSRVTATAPPRAASTPVTPLPSATTARRSSARSPWPPPPVTARSTSCRTFSSPTWVPRQRTRAATRSATSAPLIPRLPMQW